MQGTKEYLLSVLTEWYFIGKENSCQNCGKILGFLHSYGKTWEVQADHDEFHAAVCWLLSQDPGTSNGWPLGLGNLNLRLRVTERQQPATPEPYSSHAHSSSFSSFSSSNLETESTASFFQDHSVSLGRLMGIRPRERGVLYVPNTNCVDQNQSLSERMSFPDVPEKNRVEELSRGICVPLLVTILTKMTRSKSHSNRWVWVRQLCRLRIFSRHSSCIKSVA